MSLTSSIEDSAQASASAQNITLNHQAPAADHLPEVTDPTGRYSRRAFIAKGTTKCVYRALDEEEGIEVAWNEIDISCANNVDKVEREIELLHAMNHPNIIKSQGSFLDEKNKRIVFITELMTSGTLGDFIRDHSSKSIKQHVLVKYARQILTGLKYLHEDMGVIHRDLKCNNIFINGNKGEVKIGDLGLSIVSRAANTVIGTPEFMAPEMYNEHYTNAVDVWSFGLCLLEMVTGRRPYSECENVGQIFKKVSRGILPQLDIEDDKIKEIVVQCLRIDAAQRPTASQLLELPLFRENDNSGEDEDDPTIADVLPEMDFSIGQQTAIIQWLKQAPQCVQGDVARLALTRGWISQKMLDSHYIIPTPLAESKKSGGGTETLKRRSSFSKRVTTGDPFASDSARNSPKHSGPKQLHTFVSNNGGQEVTSPQPVVKEENLSLLSLDLPPPYKKGPPTPKAELKPAVEALLTVPHITTVTTQAGENHQNANNLGAEEELIEALLPAVTVSAVKALQTELQSQVTEVEGHAGHAVGGTGKATAASPSPLPSASEAASTADDVGDDRRAAAQRAAAEEAANRILSELQAQMFLGDRTTSVDELSMQDAAKKHPGLPPKSSSATL